MHSADPHAPQAILSNRNCIVKITAQGAIRPSSSLNSASHRTDPSRRLSLVLVALPVTPLNSFHRLTLLHGILHTT